MNSFGQRIGLMQKGLDAAWKRNEVIGNNIANAETSGYKASKVEFESILKSRLSGMNQQMKATDAKHMDAGGNSYHELKPVIRQNHSISMRIDGNNVDVENEMTQLAKNTLLYNVLIQKVSKEISRIKYAINEGRR